MVSESFSFWLQSKKKGAKSRPWALFLQVDSVQWHDFAPFLGDLGYSEKHFEIMPPLGRNDRNINNDVVIRTFVAALFSTHSSAKFLLFHTRWTFREFLTTYLVLLVVWPNLRQFFIEHSNAAHCSVGLVNWTKNNGSRKRIFGAKIPIHK